MKRALIIVMDSVGVGSAYDAKEYGDDGSNTLGHIADEFHKNDISFSLPNLSRWGLSKITPQIYDRDVDPVASYGICKPLSKGKDTTVGHWEMAGIILKKPFPTYPNGFPHEIITELENATGLRFIGNKTASGTVIIEELGQQHMEEKAPILYTSADSVIQIACHEDVFPIEQIYDICEKARNIADKYNIGRVIARPFEGKPGSFSRTTRRHDYSMTPPYPTVLNTISDTGINVTGVGKISDIFNGSGINQSFPTKGNSNGIDVTLNLWKNFGEGLLFVNLVDFDMLYGHRNNWKGYGESLMEFDKSIPELEATSSEGDLIIITADHGNDPTWPGTDHCRENIPVLAYKPGEKPQNIGERNTFADIGATCVAHLNVKWNGPGTPFL